MEHSEQINELAAALAKAQAEMGNAKKSSNNPYFKSKYADLAEVLDTCREALSKNCLSVVQPVGTVNDKTIEVHTMLMHSSGQWISSTMNIPMVKLDPQAAGSAITYARRYSLAAMVGIAQADDDANLSMAFTETPNNNNKPEGVKRAEQAFDNPAGSVEYTKYENGVLYLKSKNNGKWADARKVPLERLNDMLNDQDYAPAHKAIFEIMSTKGANNG